MATDSVDQRPRGFYDKERESHGTWATFVWIGSGLYLFATTEGAHFLSWQAAVFFIVGMFVAALGFGIAMYLLQRGIAKLLATTFARPSAGLAATVGVFGWVLFGVETVVVFLVARWVVERIV